MNYRKIVLIILFFAVFGLLFVPTGSAVKAMTDIERQTLIAQLQQQIALLLAQVAQLQAQQGITPAWCHTFNANIGVGIKSGNLEVEALVIALQKEGIIESGTTFPEGYDERLASAVVEFQEKYASVILTPLNLKRGTGFVGISTRAKLNALYGCKTTPPLPPPTIPPTIPPTTQTSITVLSPNGGEMWQIGSSQTVRWSSTNIPSTDKLVLRLLNSAGLVAAFLTETISNDGSESIVVPVTVQPGSYKLEVRRTKLGELAAVDLSDNYFSIVATTNCVPNWTCTAWSACANNQQTRSCPDSNNCGVITSKPSEAQSCSQLTQCTGQNSSNYYTKSSVTYGGVTIPDSCLNSTQLAEYYCTDNKTNYRYEVYNCPQGCSEGVCRTSTPPPPSGQACVQSNDIVLVIDRSGSMGGKPFADAQQGSKAFIDNMNLTLDQVGVVSFAGDATLDRQLTRNGDFAKQAIDGLTSGGSTNIGSAIKMAQDELMSDRGGDGNPIIILLSDGLSDDPLPVAEAAKKEGIRIITIGLGKDNEDLLKKIASKETDYYFAPDSEALERIYLSIFGTLQSSQPQLILSYPNGGEELRLGENIRIKWKSNGLLQSDTINIIIATDILPEYRRIIFNWPCRPSSYNWLIPSDVTLGTKYKIIVEVYRNGILYLRDDSDGYFAIIKPEIVILFPNGGEQLFAGGSVTVKWRSSGLHSSDTISLVGPRLYAASIPVESNSYNWSIPFDIFPNNIGIFRSSGKGIMQIIVYSKDKNVMAKDESDSLFTIQGPVRY